MTLQENNGNIKLNKGGIHMEDAIKEIFMNHKQKMLEELDNFIDIEKVELEIEIRPKRRIKNNGGVIKSEKNNKQDF